MAAEDAVTNWFKSLPFKLKREIAQEIKEQADSLSEDIKAAAPVSTGKLRDSVRVRRGKNTLEVFVEAGGEETTRDVTTGSGVPYDYSLGVEFGNSRSPAQPFFYSTFEEQKEDIQKAIADRVEDVLSRA